MVLEIRMVVTCGEGLRRGLWERSGSGNNPFLVLDLATSVCSLYDDSLSSTLINYVLFSMKAICQLNWNILQKSEVRWSHGENGSLIINLRVSIFNKTDIRQL